MWKGMPYMRQHLLGCVTWVSASVRVFTQGCQSLEWHLQRARAVTARNHKLRRAPGVYICATVTINTPATLCRNAPHPVRLALHTNTQTHPVARSHFGPFRCPSSRQWWLFSKLTPPTKACDHLSCQPSWAGEKKGTNKSTVIWVLKILPQKKYDVALTSSKNSAAYFPLLFAE